MRILAFASLLAIGVLLTSASSAQTVLPPGLYCVQPCPTPTALPTKTPPPTPTPPPTASPTNVPYAPSSVWNTPVSAHPTLLANSAAMVAAEFPGGQNPDGMRATEAGQYDYAHPLFFASSSDPQINLVCNQYCGTAGTLPGVPATMRIPAIARPAGGTDAHIAVVQPNGTEIDAWAAYGTPGSDTTWTAPHNQQTRNWQTGDTLTAGNVSVCGSYTAGSGLVPPPGPTAANFCLRAGVVTAAELIAGQINHALFVGAQCAIGSQYPSTGGTQQCTSGLGPPLGGRVWYDVPCATTKQNTALHPWEMAVLCALNVYGGYFGDNGSGGANYTGGILPQLESEEPWRDVAGNTYTSPFAPLAAQGWAPITIANANGSSPGNRWMYNGAAPWNPPGVNFAAHIHWLAPCSAQGTC